MAHDVFISYSSIDREVAEMVCETLEARGMTCWIAPRNVSPGVEWMDAILDAITNCHIMVLIFSRYSNESDDVKREVRLALDKKKTVIPLRTENVLPSGSMEFLLTGVHWQDAFSKPIEPHLEALSQTAGDLLQPYKKQASQSDSSDVSDLYFGVQKQLIQEYTARFVGRAYVAEKLDGFFDSKKRGYFLLHGGPGQGKTAVACHLVKERSYIHHFISRSGGRSDARLIILSLLSQFPQQNGEGLRTQTITELSKRLQDAVSQLASKEKLTIVIDGLDELPPDSAQDLPFVLTEGLPDGVLFLISSRPCDAFDSLRDTLHGVPSAIPVCEYELEPLKLSEMSEILHAERAGLSEEDIERIADASQGNPLYLRAVANELADDEQFDVRQMPSSIDGFYRRATAKMKKNDHQELFDVLGLMAVARKHLSLQELSEITGYSYRRIDELAIRPVRQFLIEVNNEFGFYHEQFRNFVTKEKELVYEDELKESHRQLAHWLQKPDSRSSNYRIMSLAYHLFEAGQTDELGQVIDEQFLEEKVRRMGYSVLEDIELLTRRMLEVGDPRLVERCVSLVDRLRTIAGSDIIDDTCRSIRSFRPGPQSFRTNVISPKTPDFDGVEIYIGMLPKAEVPADFVEIVPENGCPVFAIGDAPGTGLKSAFVARFLGNLFHSLVKRSNPVKLGDVLTKLNQTILPHDYFEFVSILCVKIDLQNQVAAVSNAGHPFPVLYSTRRNQADRLPVRGNLLRADLGESEVPAEYETRHFEMERGDVLVLVSDGLTEGHQILGEPYGYRFTRLVEELQSKNAKTIGEAILDDWKSHPREEDCADDVTVVVVSCLDK